MSDEAKDTTRRAIPTKKLSHEEAVEVARLVLEGKSPSYVKAADLLARYVLDVDEDIQQASEPPPSVPPPPSFSTPTPPTPSKKRCVPCQGSGQISIFNGQRPCLRCGGTGEV